MGLLLNKNQQQTWCFSSDETFDIRAQLEASPQKFKAIVTGDVCLEVICAGRHKITPLETIKIYKCSKAAGGR
jgi:hypothetical protein